MTNVAKFVQKHVEPQCGLCNDPQRCEEMRRCDYERYMAEQYNEMAPVIPIRESPDKP